MYESLWNPDAYTYHSITPLPLHSADGSKRKVLCRFRISGVIIYSQLGTLRTTVLTGPVLLHGGNHMLFHVWKYWVFPLADQTNKGMKDRYAYAAGDSGIKANLLLCPK